MVHFFAVRGPRWGGFLLTSIVHGLASVASLAVAAVCVYHSQTIKEQRHVGSKCRCRAVKRYTATLTDSAQCYYCMRTALGYPGRVLNFSTRVLKFSTQPPTRVCDPNRSKNTALGVFRTPGGVLGTCFAL